MLKSPGVGGDLLEAAAMQTPLLTSSADAPAAGPIQTVAPADATAAAAAAAAADASPATAPDANAATAPALPEAPPNTHFDGQGRLAPNPGCNWASNEPQDLRVICEQSDSR